MNVTWEFIQKVIPKAVLYGKELPTEYGWTVDSRHVNTNDFFVALEGARVDGHQFIESAFAQGACGALIAQDKVAALTSVIERYKKSHTFIAVPCVHKALCLLAATWRKRFSYPVIGVTGSVGKTTTKEIIGNILSSANKNYLLSQGNQNTLIGISLNILRMRISHEVAVFEMGINKRGEMAQLAELVRPTIAVITAIGHSHMEGLGSIIDIATEKRDIFKYLEQNGIGVIDGDQLLLSCVSYQHPIIKFGRKMTNQIQARKIQYKPDGIDFQLKLYQERYAVHLAVPQASRIYNVLAAATVAHALAIPSDVIIRGITMPVSVHGRFKTYSLHQGQTTVIDDSYNANPESMKAALQAFEQMEGKGTKIAVLGDMLELGINAPFWHRQLGRFLRKVPSLNQLILVGEHMAWAEKMVPLGLEVQRVPSWKDAVPVVKQKLSKNSLILVKASRGIGLNNLVDALIQNK